MLQRIRENAYKIELPNDYGVSATFNVLDLYPYYEDQEDQVDLGASLHQPGVGVGSGLAGRVWG